jgi:hypothetical protein
LSVPLACGSLYAATLMAQGAASAAGVTHYTAASGGTSPDGPSTGPARTFTDAQRGDYYAHRDQYVQLHQGTVAPAAASAFGIADSPTNPVPASQYPGAPSSTLIGRNNKNTAANGAGGSSLAEPAAINEGIRAFAGGNLSHNEYSTNGGSAWTTVAMPAGPTDAPLLWGDTDVVYDTARGLTISSNLYLNASQTNGVVRIFIRRTAAQSVANCSYTIDPAAAGSFVPDYPHLGLSNDFLYLATNNLSAPWSSQMRRFGLEEMANCLGTPTNTFTWNVAGGAPGQRIFSPAQSGIHETMYWTTLESTSTIRVWSWPETGLPSSVVRSVTAFNVANSDCRGGTNNTDWADDLTSGITGFNLRTALGDGKIRVYWNVSPDGSHPQMHMHGVVLDETGLSVVANTVVHNPTNCIGGPNIATNDRGDVGLSTTFGSKAGGGGSAPQGYVGIDDDFTSGYAFTSISLVASGTHSTGNARWGDYFKTSRQVPCGLFFTATNYALIDGTAAANVNSRFVEFGRGRDEKCYRGWRDFVRTP